MSLNVRPSRVENLENDSAKKTREIRELNLDLLELLGSGDSVDSGNLDDFLRVLMFNIRTVTNSIGYLPKEEALSMVSSVLEALILLDDDAKAHQMVNEFLPLLMTPEELAILSPLLREYLLKRLMSASVRPSLFGPESDLNFNAFIFLIRIAHRHYPDDSEINEYLLAFYRSQALIIRVLDQEKELTKGQQLALQIYFELRFGSKNEALPSLIEDEDEVAELLLKSEPRYSARITYLIYINKPHLLSREVLFAGNGLSANFSMFAEIIRVRPDLFDDEMKAQLLGEVTSISESYALLRERDVEALHKMAVWLQAPMEVVREFVRRKGAVAHPDSSNIRIPTYSTKVKTHLESKVWAKLTAGYLTASHDQLMMAKENYENCIAYYSSLLEEGVSYEEVLCLIAEQFYSPANFSYQIEAAEASDAFDFEKPCGNCEGRAIGMTMLIERIFGGREEISQIYLELFENHVRLVLDLSGELCVMEGEVPSIAYENPEGLLVPMESIHDSHVDISSSSSSIMGASAARGLLKADTFLSRKLAGLKNLPYYKEDYTGLLEQTRTASANRSDLLKGAWHEIKQGRLMGLVKGVSMMVSKVMSGEEIKATEHRKRSFVRHDERDKVTMVPSQKEREEVEMQRVQMSKRRPSSALQGRSWGFEKGKGSERTQRTQVQKMKPMYLIDKTRSARPSSMLSQRGSGEIFVGLGIALASGFLLSQVSNKERESLESAVDISAVPVQADFFDQRIARSSLALSDIDLMVQDQSSLSGHDCWTLTLPSHLHSIQGSTFTYLSNKGVKELHITGDGLDLRATEGVLANLNIDLLVELKGAATPPSRSDINDDYQRILKELSEGTYRAADIEISPCN